MIAVIQIIKDQSKQGDCICVYYTPCTMLHLAHVHLASCPVPRVARERRVRMPHALHFPHRAALGKGLPLVPAGGSQAGRGVRGRKARWKIDVYRTGYNKRGARVRGGLQQGRLALARETSPSKRDWPWQERLALARETSPTSKRD